MSTPSMSFLWAVIADHGAICDGISLCLGYIPSQAFIHLQPSEIWGLQECEDRQTQVITMENFKGADASLV